MQKDASMITVNIRKQGGAAIMTIPADVLRLLNVEVGAAMELEVTDGAFVVRPAKQQGHRRRYTLDELLDGATPEAMQALAAETEWAREGGSIGRELA